ncbi:hypothetical protein PHYBOEH_001806 [Phytophthora boehmeriae]|uniref:Uncharacterized protein n=1 Tax=Phytophthora boehmeriae TaxID=109152 RepID=A0A8T1WSG2_9STRA|nr:hypothetical protein PHYBOEH_001806 [Phytophthora boehmeriae]
MHREDIKTVGHNHENDGGYIQPQSSSEEEESAARRTEAKSPHSPHLLKEKRGRPRKVAAKSQVKIDKNRLQATIVRDNKLPTDTLVSGTTTKKTDAKKRTTSEDRRNPVKRTRLQNEKSQEQVTVETGDKLEHENVEAVDDEQKQRREMHKLERAKAECELKVKEVQLQFEKVATRTRLAQMGALQSEIDFVLPL